MDDKIINKVQNIKKEIQLKLITLFSVNNYLAEKCNKIIFFSDKITEKLKLTIIKNEISTKYLYSSVLYLISYFEAKEKTKFEFFLNDFRK